MTSNSALLLRWFKWLYLALVAGTLAYLLVSARDTDLDGGRWLRSGSVYLFCAGWIAMVVVLGKAWSLGLHQLTGIALPMRIWFPAQTSAWAGRYLPGKVGLFAGKLALLKQPDIPIGLLSLSVFYEQLAFVLVGVLVVFASPVAVPDALAGFGVLLDSLRNPFGLFLLCCVTLLATLLVRQWLRPRRESTVGLWLGQSLGVLLLHAGAHVAVGIGFHSLVLEFIAGPSTPSVGYSIGVLALAHVTGALAFFAPAGLGVREVVLAAALAPFMPLPTAVLLVTITRLVTLVADAGLFATGRLLARSAIADRPS